MSPARSLTLNVLLFSVLLAFSITSFWFIGFLLGPLTFAILLRQRWCPQVTQRDDTKIVLAGYCVVVSWSLQVVAAKWWMAYQNGTWVEDLGFARNWQIYLADMLYMSVMGVEVIGWEHYLRILDGWVCWIESEMEAGWDQSEEDVGCSMETWDLEKGKVEIFCQEGSTS